MLSWLFNKGSTKPKKEFSITKICADLHYVYILTSDLEVWGWGIQSSTNVLDIFFAPKEDQKPSIFDAHPTIFYRNADNPAKNIFSGDKTFILTHKNNVYKFNETTHKFIKFNPRINNTNHTLKDLNMKKISVSSNIFSVLTKDGAVYYCMLNHSHSLKKLNYKNTTYIDIAAAKNYIGLIQKNGAFISFELKEYLYEWNNEKIKRVFISKADNRVLLLSKQNNLFRWNFRKSSFEKICNHMKIDEVSTDHGSVFIRSKNKWYGWGYNEYGQLGMNYKSDSITSCQPLTHGSNADKIFPCIASTYFIKDGRVYGCGKFGCVNLNFAKKFWPIEFLVYDKDNYYGKAFAWFMHEDYMMAAKCLEKVVKKNYVSRYKSNIYRMLGYCYFKLEEYQKAHKMFGKCRLGQNDVEIYKYWLCCCHHIKEYHQVIKIIQEKPKLLSYSKLHNFVGNALYYLEYLKEATCNYNLNTADTNDCINLGDCYYRLKKYEDAIVAFERAIEKQKKFDIRPFKRLMNCFTKLPKSKKFAIDFDEIFNLLNYISDVNNKQKILTLFNNSLFPDKKSFLSQLKTSDTVLEQQLATSALERKRIFEYPRIKNSFLSQFKEKCEQTKKSDIELKRASDSALERRKVFKNLILLRNKKLTYKDSLRFIANHLTIINELYQANGKVIPKIAFILWAFLRQLGYKVRVYGGLPVAFRLGQKINDIDIVTNADERVLNFLQKFLNGCRVGIRNTYNLQYFDKDIVEIDIGRMNKNAEYNYDLTINSMCLKICEKTGICKICFPEFCKTGAEDFKNGIIRVGKLAAFAYDHSLVYRLILFYLKYNQAFYNKFKRYLSFESSTLNKIKEIIPALFNPETSRLTPFSVCNCLKKLLCRKNSHEYLRVIFEKKDKYSMEMEFDKIFPFQIKCSPEELEIIYKQVEIINKRSVKLDAKSKESAKIFAGLLWLKVGEHENPKNHLIEDEKLGKIIAVLLWPYIKKHKNADIEKLIEVKEYMFYTKDAKNPDRDKIYNTVISELRFFYKKLHTNSNNEH